MPSEDASNAALDLNATQRQSIRFLLRVVNEAEYGAFINIRGYRNLLVFWIVILVGFLIFFPLAVLRLDRGFWVLSGQNVSTTIHASDTAASTTTSSTSTATTTTGQTNTTSTTTGTTSQAGPAVAQEPDWGSTRAIATLEVWGAIGGLVGVLVALRRIRGFGGPYGLPFAQTVLKVLAGAATALLGIVIVQSQVIPGLATANDKALAAYAALFGFAQESVTRFVDRQAGRLLGQARSTSDPERPPTASG
jgi:hypothetical protein